MQNKETIISGKIRLDIIFGIIWRKRKKFAVPAAVVLIAVYLLMCCIPRYYSVKVTLAPEYESSMPSGGLSSLASLANINLGSLGNSSDALTPTSYPDLMKSTDFIVPLLFSEVKTADGKFTGTYRDYLTKKQKQPWWDVAMFYTKEFFSKKKVDNSINSDTFDPFRLTRPQSELVDAVTANISCMVDKKTDVITITTKAQDPLVAALLADTVKKHLQEFIIEYRTHKARIELERIQKIAANAYADYQKKQREYAAYSDSHQNVVLAEYKVKEEDLENELQLAYNTYSAAKAQEAIAQSKLLSRTPAFTTLQNATVPIRPAGPKRLMTAIAMALLCIIGMSVYYVSKELKKKKD